MLMLETLSSCPCGSVSSCNGVTGKGNPACGRNSSRVRVPARICYHGSKSGGIGWSRWMAGQENLVARSVQNRQVERTRWCGDGARSGLLSSGNDSWLRKLPKLDRLHAEGDSQETAVVDVHVRFSLSRPKRNLADSVSRLAPRWFRSLKGVESLLPHHLPQNGGGGNRDGDFSMRLGYGGDDDSHHERKGSRRLLRFYTWWAASVASMSALVWALRHYSGVPQRAQFSVAQFVDCVVWLGLAWCSATVLLWAARLVVSFSPASLGYRNAWNLFTRSRLNAFSSGREFVLRSKVDEWMAQNVVAVPGMVISLVLVCELIHYGTNIINTTNLFARIQSQVCRVFEILNSRVDEATKGGGPLLLSRGSAEKKGRRGTSSSSSSKWRRR